MSQRNFAVRQNKQTQLTRMSALKTVAFMEEKKNVADRKEACYYSRQRRHVLTLYQVQCWGIWGTEGPGILSVFLVLPSSNNKSPIETGSPFFFFSQNKHTKLPVLACNCPRLREPHVAVLWCTCLRHKLLCCAGKTTFFGSVHSRGKFIHYNV